MVLEGCFCAWLALYFHCIEMSSLNILQNMFLQKKENHMDFEQKANYG